MANTSRARTTKRLLKSVVRIMIMILVCSQTVREAILIKGRYVGGTRLVVMSGELPQVPRSSLPQTTPSFDPDLSIIASLPHRERHFRVCRICTQDTLLVVQTDRRTLGTFCYINSAVGG